MKRLGFFKVLLLAITLMVFSVPALGDVFVPNDKVNVSIGPDFIGTPSVVTTVEYSAWQDGSFRLYVGNGFRVTGDDKDDSYRLFVSPSCNIPLEHDYKYLPKELDIFVRIGASLNLDKDDGGVYAGVGVRAPVWKNVYTGLMWESDDKRNTGSLVVGVHLDTLWIPDMIK
ncbi:MAG: hypothetical protein ACRC92_11350 [Peptostreptococcaceae bacterium]